MIAVLNSERLFGHYDAYADIMSEYNAVQGENRVLRERIRELKLDQSSGYDPSMTNHTKAVDQGVQVVQEGKSSVSVDRASDPIFAEPKQRVLKTDETQVRIAQIKTALVH